MPATCNKAGILLAIDALKQHNSLSVREAAKMFNVSCTMLQCRLKRHPSRHDTVANSKKLTASEEKVLLEYIIDLDSRAFPPKLCGVEDMANILLQQLGVELVRKN